VNETIELATEDDASISQREKDRHIFARLSHIAEQSADRRSYYRDALEAIADHFHAQSATLLINDGTFKIEETTGFSDGSSAAWERITEAMLLETQSSGKARARLYQIDGSQFPLAFLGVPLGGGGQKANGATVLAIISEDRTIAEQALFQLESLVSLISSQAYRVENTKSVATSEDSGIERALLKAAEHSCLEELAFAITNGLKTKFSCNQVSLGLVTKQTVRLVSISEMDAVYPRSPGTTQIRQAMEECFDAREIIAQSLVLGAEPTSDNSGYRLHLQWSAAIGNAPVASIPLLVNENCVAVVSLTRPKGKFFEADDLKRIVTAVQPFAPALLMVARSGRSLTAHVKESVQALYSAMLQRGGWKRKIIFAAMTIFAIWFCLAEMPYHRTVPCTITADSLQSFAAPFEGQIAAAHVQIGDQVEQGQLLYKMDVTDLELLQAELYSEAEVTRLKAAHAVSEQDFDTAALATAQLRILQSKMETLTHQIERSEVRAPGDGRIMSGEVSKRVGEVVPLGEPMIQFAPDDAWNLDLHLPADEIYSVQQGMQGEFATLARPSESIRFEIHRIRPCAETIDGRNVFVATAHVERNPLWMRVGMQGMATVHAGRKAVWWIAFHRMIDFARLHTGI